MASDCTREEASFVSLDDLDNISILLDEHNDLEKEITLLFILLIYKYILMHEYQHKSTRV